MNFLDTMTLGEAREQLRALVEDGHRCPCCSQYAKVYRRKIHSGMAFALILMWRHSRDEWLYKPDVLRGIGSSSRDESLIRYWGLIEEETELRPDGGRSGWWRVTLAGGDWVRGFTRISKYALVYDGRCLGFRGERVSIREALGSKFNYDELMEGL